MDIKNGIDFRTGQEWREWLEQYHDKETGAWLTIYKKGSKKNGIRYDEALEEALCFGWIDGIMRSIDGDKFILRFSPRQKKSIWSRMNRDKAEQLIADGKMTPAGMAKIEEARGNGTWENAYTMKKKEKMPVDLQEALSGNKAAQANFEKFANSYRNMYIGWVNDAKTDTTRKRRISEVVKRSLINKKPGIE